MKDNTCEYSDNWQPYKMDYDKFEYDIKLKNGTIIKSCYPNAGKFNSMSNEHNGESFNEDLVDEIRFSNNPIIGINDDVSNINQSINTESYIEFESNPKGRKEERLYNEIRNYCSGKFSLKDVKKQIENKVCSLPRAHRDLIMRIIQ